MDNFCNTLKKNVNATGVYIGKLEQRMRVVKDNEDDKAHIEEDAPLVIKYKYAD